MSKNFESLFCTPVRILSGLASLSQRRPRGAPQQGDRRACMAPATAKAGRITSALLVSFFALGASAQESTESINIVGMRDPQWKAYADFVRGMDVYEQRKAELAPGSTFAFVLLPVQAGLKMEGLSLRLEADELNIPIPLSPSWEFILPRSKEAEDAKAELGLNQKKGLYTWRPKVRSPGMTDTSGRLGDFRLECHIRWAVEKNDLPFPARLAIGALGACESARVNVVYRSRTPVASIEMQDGERKLTLPASRLTKEGYGFILPLHDKTWSNDTAVRLTYKE